jgi:superfamily II DNA or RNA helicase
MADIKITKINSTWMKVLCQETYQELDIQDRFSFKIPDAKHDPRVKKGIWDGIKKLYNRKTKRMPIGLLVSLIAFLEKCDYTYDIDPNLLPDDGITKDEIADVVSYLVKPHKGGEPIEPYDYQIEAVEYMLNMGRGICLSATSSGKSLIIYLAVRLYQLLDETQGKTIFITVPSSDLVEQMYDDFAEFSQMDDDWHVNAWCQKVNMKYTKFIEKQVVITTWQSMKKMSFDAIENAGAIFVDECHTAKADVLSGMLESMTSCDIKHGLTGTLDGFEANETFVEGVLGPPKRIVTSREIIDMGNASEVEVHVVVLDHSEETRKQYRRVMAKTPRELQYRAEVQFIDALAHRRDMILDMIDSVEGNTLTLFDRVEEYGKELHDQFILDHPYSTFLIVGEVEGDDRKDIRHGMEDQENAVIFASYGTMSTGISINKLHNMFLISSTKSKIRVLQSIGRMMRKHKSKEVGFIFDIVDDLSSDTRTNFVFNHAIKRLEYYKKEQFKIKFHKIKI